MGLPVQFWGTHEKPTLDQKRDLAEQIIAASGPMPDANRHLLHLLTVDMDTLQERLEQIERESGKARSAPPRPAATTGTRNNLVSAVLDGRSVM